MLTIHGKVYIEEKIHNKSRKFGANAVYVPAHVEGPGHCAVPALFTLHELEIAMERATLNPEDCKFKQPGFFARLFHR